MEEICISKDGTIKDYVNVISECHKVIYRIFITVLYSSQQKFDGNKYLSNLVLIDKKKS